MKKSLSLIMLGCLSSVPLISGCPGGNCGGGAYNQNQNYNQQGYNQGYQGSQPGYNQGYQGQPGYNQGYQGSQPGYNQGYQGSQPGYNQGYQGQPGSQGQQYNQRYNQGRGFQAYNYDSRQNPSDSYNMQGQGSDYNRQGQGYDNRGNDNRFGSDYNRQGYDRVNDNRFGSDYNRQGYDNRGNDNRFGSDYNRQGYDYNRQGQGYSQGYYDNSQQNNYSRQMQQQGGYAPQSYGYYETAEGDRYAADQNQKTVSDQDIQRKVHNALSSWFSNEYKNVSFDVNNGVVTLRGTVNTEEEKRKAEDSVRKIDGVRQVNNQINVTEAKTALNDQNQQNTDNANDEENKQKYPYDYAATPADKQINEKIREKLKGGWFSKGYEGIVIRTTNGVVIIAGRVDKPEDIKKINESLKNVEGIRSINNQAQVAPKNENNG